jgi:hypothetical protein
MSDAQLIQFFKKPTTDSVCGRLTDRQLEHTFYVPKRKLPWVRYFLQVAIPAFLFSAKASAQGKVKASFSNQQTLVSCRMDFAVKGEVSADKGDMFEGRVITENGDAIPFASIVVKQTDHALAADSSGHFKIRKELLPEGGAIEISSVGFTSKQLNIDRDFLQSSAMLIQLTGIPVLSEVVVCSYGTIMGKFAITRSVDMVAGAVSVSMKETNLYNSLPAISTKPHALMAYPNPVVPGTNININCKKLERGYYTFQLINLAGQLIDSKPLWLDGETGAISVLIPQVPAGNYFMKMIGKESGEQYSGKLLIQR